MKLRKFLLGASLFVIGASSVYAGFTGDTAPVYSNEDGMMHIMDTPTTTSTPVVGGDSDAHGCKGSAGYSYSDVYKKCVRSWEVASQTLSGTTWKSLTVDKKIFTKGTLTFSGNTIGAKLCNSIGVNYTTSNGKISAPALFSTRMFCADKSGEAEDKFQLDGAKYIISENGKTLVIKTAAGNIFKWRKVK